MRYNLPEATDDWNILEVVKRKRRPCSDAYADSANDDDLVAIFRELRLLRATGQPPDRTKGNPETQKVGQYKPAKGKTIDVYILKAKPSGWRLYFWMKDRAKKEIEFLYAVNKKQNKRDPADLKKCCGLLTDIFAGKTESEVLDIPDRGEA